MGDLYGVIRREGLYLYQLGAEPSRTAGCAGLHAGKLAPERCSAIRDGGLKSDGLGPIRTSTSLDERQSRRLRDLLHWSTSPYTFVFPGTATIGGRVSFVIHPAHTRRRR